MEISKESWHYKLFIKWRGLKFRKGWIPYRYDGGISLCCYVKVIFLFAVPRIIFQSNITRLGVLNIFLSLIIYGELTSNLFMRLMILISGYLLAVGVGVLFLLLIATIIHFFTESKTSENIIKPYLRARKDNICPHIDFIDKEDI